MDISNIRKLCYELYKIDWMRKISAEMQMDELKNYFEERYEAGMLDDNYSFDDYIFDNGYGRSIYVCFDEFLGTEYKNEACMEDLLDNDNLYRLYKEDLYQIALDEDRARMKIAVKSVTVADTGGRVKVYYGGLDNGLDYALGSESLIICDADYGETLTDEFFNKTEGDTFDWEQKHVKESFDLSSDAKFPQHVTDIVMQVFSYLGEDPGWYNRLLKS